MRRLQISEKAVKSHESAYALSMMQALDLISSGNGLNVKDGRYTKKLKLKPMIAPSSAKSIARKYYRLVRRLNYIFKLLHATPSDLEVVRLRFDRFETLLAWLSSKGNLPDWKRELTAAKKNISRLFDYVKFGLGRRLEYVASGPQSPYVCWIDGYDTWSAWHFLKSLNVGACCYCNGDGVFSLLLNRKPPGGAACNCASPAHKRSPFDHFYGHARYPALGISLYNMIPSCTRCNTNVKGAREQSQALHIHPYLDSLRDYIRFYVVLKSLPFGRLPEDDDVSVVVRERFPVKDQSKVTRALQSCGFFHLEEVYNQVYIKIVGDAVRRAIAFSTTYRKDMETQYPGINVEIIDRMLYGAVICSGDENYYPFAAVIGDVNEQLHLSFRLI